MEMRDCPKWESCSAPVCPLDSGCLGTVHLEGERICYYLCEAVKDHAEAHFQACSLEEIYERVVRVLPAISETYPPVRRALEKARKSGSRMMRFKGVGR